MTWTEDNLGVVADGYWSSRRRWNDDRPWRDGELWTDVEAGDDPFTDEDDD